MIEFGQRLKSLRKQKNLTQKQLAELIGTQNSIISFYEVGDRIPSPEVIIKLARTLHVSTDYLLGLEKNESVDISTLSEHDKSLVRSLIYSLSEKNLWKCSIALFISYVPFTVAAINFTSSLSAYFLRYGIISSKRSFFTPVSFLRCFQ